MPSLDLNRYMGLWYQVAVIPNKLEKHCVGDATVLYALGDKARSFQFGEFCQFDDGGLNEHDATGSQDKTGDGKLKIGRFWPFTHKAYVLGLGPNYEWAVVGYPNHKSLWILSRTPMLAPGVADQLTHMAAAAGFNTRKLVTLPPAH